MNNAGKPPFLLGKNVGRLIKQSSNSPLLIQVEMKLQGRVPTSNNISPTPAVVEELSSTLDLQGDVGGSL